MSKIDLLALPKKTSSFCEVCRRPGAIRCSECKVTHYCSDSHRDLDWKSFHRLVCRDLLVLRDQLPFPIEEAERELIQEEVRKKQFDIQKRAEGVARELLLKEEPELAYSPAMQAFHLVQELSGDGSLEAVRNYALMSEVYLGLNDMKMAQDYFLQAAWTVEKRERVSADILSVVQRIKGKVYMNRGIWERANEAFAEYVYCLAEQYSTADVRVGIGLGYLGLTIKALGHKMDVAIDLYDKMAWMWLDRLLEQYITKTLKIPSEKEMEDPETRENECLLLEAKLLFKSMDASIHNVKDPALLDSFVFKLFAIQALLSIREQNEEKKQASCEAALQVATRKRMDDAVKEDKRKHLNEVLGDDYLVRWDRKHARERTIATKYLDQVKDLVKG